MGLAWLLAAGCDDPGGTTALDAGDTGALDATQLDASPPVDAHVDARARPVDASLPPLRDTVRTCAEACHQQTRCGSALPGCEAACAAADEADRAAWFACLSTLDCAVVERCALPRPEAPDCPALCEAACDLPDCEARCAAARPGFQACRGLRDCDAHRACLDRAAWPACAAQCERAAACGAGSADPCTLACSAPPGDPLRDARQAAWRACLADAPDCEAYRRCAQRPAAPATFCAAWQACGLGGEAVCLGWVEEQIPATLACAAATLDAGCPADGLVTLEARCGAGPASCRAACEASRRCGVLDAAAAQACEAACDGAPPRPSAACADAETCAALAACHAEHEPALVCPVHCAALDACGAGDAACPEACAADFDTDRARDLRHCVQVAPDCGATLACVAARPDPCDAVCERFGACYDDAGCADECASVPVDDGGDGLRYLACLATSRACLGPRGLAACAGDVAAGDACLGYCLAREGCDPPTADLSPCLAACRDGLPPDEAARFGAAWPCLRMAPPGHCPSAAACLAPAAAPDCPAAGAAWDACGLAPPACAADPLTAARVERAAACPAAPCPDALACQGLAPAAPIADAALCAALTACDVPCDAVRTDDPAARRCVLAALTDCDLTAALGCTVERPSPACLALCDARGVCEGVDREACLLACADLPEDGLPDARACGGALDCPTLAACLAHDAARCAVACDRGAVCDPAFDSRACTDACQLGGPIHRAALACAEAADACPAVRACPQPVMPPCEAACARAVACGGAEATCQAMCREAGAAFTTCVASAPACLGPGGVQGCLRGELDGPCVRACACAPEATREACLVACGAGPGGGAALALTDACLVDCPAHAACLAEPSVDCVGLCDRLAACEVQPERCVTACRAAPDVAVAGCVADAGRLQGGCAAVRACVGEPAPAVDPGCLALCAAQARCTGEEPIDCALRCGASGPETPIRAACAAAMDCGRQAVCDALDGTLNPSCGPLCRAAAACGLDEAACRATCTGVLATGRDPGYLTRVPACLRDGCDAAAAARCLVPPVRPCEVLCDAAAACGDADEGCVAACDEAGLQPDEISGYVIEWDAACP